MSKSLLALLVVLHVAAGVAFTWSAPHGFPLDDAWVHLVYARSVAVGEVFAYNAGVPEAGVTSPLWTLMCAVPVGVADLLGARPDLGMRLLGGLVGFGAACAAVRLALRGGNWPMWSVAVVFALDPLTLFGRYSGMEQPLFALLVLLYAEAWLEQNVRQQAWLAGLLVITRPEAGLLVIVSVGALALRRQWKLLGPFALRAAVPIVPWVAYCWTVNGTPFPNTAHKLADPALSEWLPALHALMLDTGLAWALPVLLLVGVISLEGQHRGLGRGPALIGAILLLGVLVTRPITVAPTSPPTIPYYWERYLLLAWPLLLFLASAGAASLVRTAYAGLYCRPRAAILLTAPLVVVALLGYRWPAHALDVAQRFAAQCDQVERQQVAAGLWAAEHLPPDALIATHDAGAIKFFSGRDVLDVYGNNATELSSALRAGEGAGMGYARLLARYEPDALMVYPAIEDWRMLALNYDLRATAATFSVDESVTVPGPAHVDFTVFVARD